MEVRVTAHQDTTGEWRAKQVEILKIATRMAEAPQKIAALPNFTHFSWLLQITNQEEFRIASTTEKSN